MTQHYSRRVSSISESISCTEAQRDIQQQALDDLADAKLDVHLSFYLTSIYDHSIFEAFSKVIQELIPQLPILENLLNILNTVRFFALIAWANLRLTRAFCSQNCRLEKSFLIDVVSKIYVATDSSPVDMQTYELCSDMIDVVIDVSCIYGMKEDTDGLAYDDKSQSIIKLSNGMVLYLREVNKYILPLAFELRPLS